MKVAICDDESRWVEEIKERIEDLRYEETMEVEIDCFTNQEELLEKAAAEKYHLIYLDIEMEGKNGIEVARILKECNPTCIVIFVTAFENYVTDAFKVSAFQYISKPIDYRLFKAELQRAINKYKKTNLIKIFKVKEGKRAFNLSEIISVESYYNTTLIRTTRGTFVTNYENLRKIRKEILDYDFVRVQSGFIVNMNYIIGMKYREVELVTGQVLSVSMTGFQRVLEKYHRFLNTREWSL